VSLDYRCGCFTRERAPGRRVWAIEGTGSFGAGLTSFLREQAEWVVEVDRPARPARRNGAKSDQLDAARAATEALSRQHLAQPRRRGDREALRVLLATRQGAILARTQAIGQLKGLIINAPEGLRRQKPTNAEPSRARRLGCRVCAKVPVPGTCPTPARHPPGTPRQPGLQGCRPDHPARRGQRPWCGRSRRRRQDLRRTGLSLSGCHRALS